jgi:hypothetical protein
MNNQVDSNALLRKNVLSTLAYYKLEYVENRAFKVEGFPGNKIKVHIYVLPCPIFPKGLAIDVRNQDTGGTIYEKFPYLLIKMGMLPVPGLFIMEGQAFLKEHSNEQWWRDWLFNRVVHEKDLLGVMWLHEFRTWLRTLSKNTVVPKLGSDKMETQVAGVLPS